MKSKRSLFLSISVLLVVGLLFAAIPTGKVSAAILCVNPEGTGGCYTTIQAAIDAASPGDTVNVAAGTYDEPLNIEGRTNISIVGEDKNTTIIKSSTSLGWGYPPGGSYGETRQTMIRVVGSTDIDFSNFTFDFSLMKTAVPGIDYVSGIWYWSSTGTINNNILKDIGILDDVTKVSLQEHTIYVRAMTEGGYSHATRADVYITNNEFINTGRTGVNTHDYVNVAIDDNLFHKDAPYNSSGSPYDLGYAREVGSESIGTVTYNTIYGYEEGEDWTSAGIYIENAFTDDVPTPGFTKNVSIEGNEVYNSEVGVVLGCESTLHGEVSIVIAFSNNNIHDNRLEGVRVVDHDAGDGSSVTVNAQNNTITNNGDYGYNIFTNGDGDVTFSATNETITNHDYGVYIDDLAPASSVYAITINASNISNNTTYGLYNGITTQTVASDNWWGSTSGPGPVGPGSGDNVSTNVDYSPWCGDSACSFTVKENADGNIEILPGTSAADIQTVIDSLSTGDTLVLPAEVVTPDGGFTIDTPGVTIVLQDGTVVQSNSPCFVVDASYTTITAESLGAQCIPTVGSNGIDVTAGLVNITIEGIEFIGTAGTDGIHFAGAITDVVIADNWFHGFAGDGIEFTAQPAGTVDIHGNLFQNNTGNGIEAGSFTVPAEYNSWGDYDGATVGVGGDGISTAVDADPWTHVDLYLTSTGTPWANQVVSGQNITYTVYGNLNEVNAADFVLTYPTNLTYVSSAASGTFFSETLTPTTGSLHFIAYNTTGNVSGTKPLFTVTFTAGTPVVDAALNLDELTDGFGMAGVGSSSNVYAAALVDSTVTVITLPAISSTDIQGYYLTGEPRDFNVKTFNPTDGAEYTNVLFRYTIYNATLSDIESFTYPGGDMPLIQDGDNLVGYFGDSSVGFPMHNDPYDITTLFNIEFNTAKDYVFELTLVDLIANTTLETYTNTAVVYTQPIITSLDLVGPYLVGIPQNFKLTITDEDGIPEPFELVFDLPEGTIIVYDSVTYTCLSTGCPPIPVTLTGTSNDLDFTVTFAAPFNDSITVSLYDSDWTPDDRLLATLTQSGVIAYANFDVTGTVSMQGRTFRGGVLMTLTANAVPYGPYGVTSINHISNNLSFANVPADTYTITITMARYLDLVVNEYITKVILVDGNITIASLELKGGDANDDNIVDVGDASIIGTQYGKIGSNGDVNYSGWVDIFDLALVGGNYGADSASAYGSWTP